MCVRKHRISVNLQDAANSEFRYSTKNMNFAHLQDAANNDFRQSIGIHPKRDLRATNI